MFRASVRLAKFDKDGWLSFTTFLNLKQYSESAGLGNSQWRPAMSAAARHSSPRQLVLLFQRPEADIT